MFDSELFEMSEKIVRQIDHDGIKERNFELEKRVVEIIKNHIDYIDDNGIATIRIPSRNLNSKNEDYMILKKIVDSKKQKYYQDEYSLYFIRDDYVEVYSKAYNVITFVWDSVEYNMRNNSYVKAKEIIKRLDNQE